MDFFFMLITPSLKSDETLRPCDVTSTYRFISPRINDATKTIDGSKNIKVFVLFISRTIWSRLEDVIYHGFGNGIHLNREELRPVGDKTTSCLL